MVKESSTVGVLAWGNGVTGVAAMGSVATAETGWACSWTGGVNTGAGAETGALVGALFV